VAVVVLGSMTLHLPAAAAASPGETAPARRALPAGPPTGGAVYAPAPGRLDLPQTAPDLALVRVDSSDFRRADSRYQQVAGNLADAQARHAAADHALSAAATRAAQLDAAVASAAGRRGAAAARLSQVVGSIQELAVDAYLSGGETSDLALALDVRPAIEPESRRVLADASLETLVAERKRVAAQLADADVAYRDATSARAALTAQHDAAVAARQDALVVEASSAPELIGRRAELEDARVLATVSGTDFSLVAMDAYYRAAELADAARPACGIAWWGLAGISRVEGHHGTFGGSSLDRDGNTTRPIIGIPLDGANATQAIHDTDHGTIDGDPNVDRAVGPMQFIPSTWRMYASDGNGDEKQDPQNIYDATLAAGTYLCRAASGLADDPGLRAAYFSYNHSEAYVDNVLGWARGYEQVRIPKI
jgi:membrane-bound lytic murein transglycosylase B